KMERVKRFLERNTLRKVNLKDAAQEVCLSRKYLSRIFKERTGMGFNEYRLKLKMDKARDLLTRTDAPVDRLSHELGYKNMESFVRIFKKMVGATPTTYRHGHRSRSGHGKREPKKFN
ncbi:MAG TPA: AraC family transcriptional regulator, partial [Candidatus Omnitrophota bacterium]|nr:AraC family transcriptional regulator [Candidatus Omnitrophota bacterium]